MCLIESGSLQCPHTYITTYEPCCADGSILFGGPCTLNTAGGDSQWTGRSHCCSVECCERHIAASILEQQRLNMLIEKFEDEKVPIGTETSEGEFKQHDRLEKSAREVGLLRHNIHIGCEEAIVAAGDRTIVETASVP